MANGLLTTSQARESALPLRPATIPPGVPAVGPSQQMQNAVLTLAAGETRQVIIQGQWLYVKELYAVPGALGAQDINIASDICGPLPYNVGTGFRFPIGSQFRYLQVENPSADSVYMEITAGYGDYIDNRLNIVRVRPSSIQPTIEPPIEIDAWLGDPVGTYEIPAGSFVEFLPVITGLRMAQKGFTLANADPNSALLVADVAGIPYGRVIANTSQLFPCGEGFRIYNTTGAAIVCYVGQLYWLGS
jgi:hypothetical protein